MDFIQSLTESILEGLAKNENVVRWRKRYPNFFDFVEKRLSLSNPYGLYFSFGVVVSAVAFFYFLALTQDIVAKDPFVEADIRLMNLVAALRSVATAKALLLFTYLGNWQFIVSLGIICLVILALLREKRKLIFLVVGVSGGELLYTVFKLLLHRTRPDVGFSLISRNGYAFPSGHAVVALIFYGMVGYALCNTFKNRLLKILSVGLASILIFLIGFSRIYLGAHWVSDVLAGWAFGISFLVLLITFFKQQERFKPEVKNKSFLPTKFVFVISALLLIFEGIFFYYFYTRHPLREPPSRQLHTVTIFPQSHFQTAVLADNFPKFSETVIGEKMEPISFIVVGSTEHVVRIFQKSGWFMADEPHYFKNVYHLAIAAIFNQPYPTASVTPSFVNAQPNTFAFEKPTEANTVRQRHHIRFWLTNFELDGIPIWIATASFDDGVRYFITHKIHPDIDTEREFIKNDLVKTDLVREDEQIQLVKPLLGKNQSNDQFFTDGKAYVVFLK